jgi:hypothetical protein
MHAALADSAVVSSSKSDRNTTVQTSNATA